MDDGDRLMAATARAGAPKLLGYGLLNVVDTVVSLWLPGAIAAALDAALRHTASGAVLTAAVLLGVATLVELGEQLLPSKISIEATVGLRLRFFRHFLGLGLRGQREYVTGDVLSRLVEGAADTAGAGPAIIDLFASFATAVGGVVLLLRTDLLAGSVFLLATPALWWVTRWFMRRTTTLSTEYQQVHARLVNRFVDAGRGVRTIRASGTVDREIDRVLAPLPELQAAGAQMWAAQRRAGWQLSLLAPVFQIGVLAVAGFGVATGRVSPGGLLAVSSYLGYAMGLLQQATLLAQLGRLRGAARRVAQPLARPVLPTGQRPLPPGPLTVRLRGVHVADAANVLVDDVDLDVPAGRTLALVGRSGAGKSTVAAVAGGLIAPDRGEVTIGGIPLPEVAPRARSAAVAFAFERPELLGETIADALTFGDLPVDADALARACVASRADGFIERLPDGQHTALARLRLSGGEVQRLGLARAAARRPRVVVLDDALSSVDTITEREIQRALAENLAGATKIVVAHRQTTAATADLVAWLDNGRIRAVAPHADLMEHPGYRAVFGAAQVSA